MAKQWIPWPHDECRDCGGSVEVETDADQSTVPEELHGTELQPPFVYDGDRWRCEDGHGGRIYCDSETPARLE